MTNHLTRREALGALGAGAALLVIGCGDDKTTTATTGSTATAATSPQASGACVLTPELTEGPYYLPDSMIRRDITEGRPGTALRLELSVQDLSQSCAPVEGATVEIWHADASGEYSGFGGAASDSTFLRGGQTSDADGNVVFETVFPGWYQGRTAHIHLKVAPGGDTVHTGQLFFDDSVYEQVYTKGEYASRGGADTTNANDNIYAQSGGASTLTLNEQGDGYVGKLVLGMQSA